MLQKSVPYPLAVYRARCSKRGTAHRCLGIESEFNFLTIIDFFEYRITRKTTSFPFRLKAIHHPSQLLSKTQLVLISKMMEFYSLCFLRWVTLHYGQFWVFFWNYLKFRPFMAILNATTMVEMGRAFTPNNLNIRLGFHGGWVSHPIPYSYNATDNSSALFSSLCLFLLSTNLF